MAADLQTISEMSVIEAADDEGSSDHRNSLHSPLAPFSDVSQMVMAAPKQDSGSKLNDTPAQEGLDPKYRDPFIESALATFDELDRSRSGTLSIQEIQDVLTEDRASGGERLPLNMSAADVLTAFDANSDGVVTRDEFMSFLAPYVRSTPTPNLPSSAVTGLGTENTDHWISGLLDRINDAAPDTLHSDTVAPRSGGKLRRPSPLFENDFEAALGKHMIRRIRSRQRAEMLKERPSSWASASSESIMYDAQDELSTIVKPQAVSGSSTPDHSDKERLQFRIEDLIRALRKTETERPISAGDANEVSQELLILFCPFSMHKDCAIAQRDALQGQLERKQQEMEDALSGINERLSVMDAGLFKVQQPSSLLKIKLRTAVRRKIQLADQMDFILHEHRIAMTELTEPLHA